MPSERLRRLAKIERDLAEHRYVVMEYFKLLAEVVQHGDWNEAYRSEEEFVRRHFDPVKMGPPIEIADEQPLKLRSEDP